MNTRFTKSGYSISVKVALARPKGLTLTALRKIRLDKRRGISFALTLLETAFGVSPLLPCRSACVAGAAPTAGDACVVGIADSHGGGGVGGFSGVAAGGGEGDG